ncbi:MAG TPA: PLP-dependent transferase [Verrucomicrobiae bacterium]|nr:PLP-dependent transferase [Verrucomicrobiae bacterium]
MPSEPDFGHARQLSPRRSSSQAVDIPGLVAEQLAHFAIDPKTELGRTLGRLAAHIYGASVEMHQLWDLTIRELSRLDRRERIAAFNAKKFLCFQLAKLLDTLQNPFRQTYQSLVEGQSSRLVKGPYPIFDNVTAIFSSTPVIARTATYLYACTEWIDDAFQGREPLLEVYSRLLNPTSISLANHIVDLECGPLAGEHMAWNFNSGMAAIDATLSHLVGYQDIILSSRNIYGGAFQLLHDWFQKPANLDVGVRFFDGCELEDFRRGLAQVRTEFQDRVQAGKQIYVYLESPCNPHGYVLDVPAICATAHEEGLTVILDSTIATPFLCQPLCREHPAERPDFLIHSYTKDITGTGTTTAGVVIARNERMFVPKGQSASTHDLSGRSVTYRWDETLFWNVFYVKGAFLDADKAFEVINGSRTLEMRMLRKTISTIVLARFLASHPLLHVKSHALDDNENAALRQRSLRLGLPAPLFTIDFERAQLDRITFTRFFDCLEPAFGHQVSLGQANTVILCPGLTSHSEMGPEELREAGITPTTVRIAVGDEDPRQLIAHFIQVSRLVLDPARPGFSSSFMAPADVDALYRSTYLDVHQRWVDALPNTEELLR